MGIESVDDIIGSLNDNIGAALRAHVDKYSGRLSFSHDNPILGPSGLDRSGDRYFARGTSDVYWNGNNIGKLVLIGVRYREGTGKVTNNNGQTPEGTPYVRLPFHHGDDVVLHNLDAARIPCNRREAAGGLMTIGSLDPNGKFHPHFNSVQILGLDPNKKYVTQIGEAGLPFAAYHFGMFPALMGNKIEAPGPEIYWVTGTSGVQKFGTPNALHSKIGKEMALAQVFGAITISSKNVEASRDFLLSWETPLGYEVNPIIPSSQQQDLFLTAN